MRYRRKTRREREKVKEGNRREQKKKGEKGGE